MKAPRTNTHTVSHPLLRAYTLVEALVASSVLLIGISAASSMTLSMLTQEEISERANRAINYIDDSVRLLQLGVDPGVVSDLLPPCEEIIDTTIEFHPVTIPNLGTRDRIWVKFAWTTSGATENSGKGLWTGGEKDTERKLGFYLYRDQHYLTERLARAAWVTANP